MKWAIQSGQRDSELFLEACIELGLEYSVFDYVPFSGQIPEGLPKVDVMFYGSVGICQAVGGSGVISIDQEWVRHPKALNLEADYDRLRDYIPWHNRMFIRPYADDKLFSGQVMTKVEFLIWRNALEEKEMWDILNAYVLVSKAQDIPHEWRCFVVNGQFSTGSHYRSYGQLMTSADVPQEVVDFVEANVFNYSVYCIDVCQDMQGELKIVELNGFNSCGVYSSNVKKLLGDIDAYFH